LKVDVKLIPFGTSSVSSPNPHESFVLRLDAALSPTPGSNWFQVDKKLQDGLFTAVNAHRSTIKKPAYVWDQYLQACAEFYAREMAWFGFMQHDSPEEPGYPAESWFDRQYSFGVSPRYGSSENLAYGFDTVDTVMTAWLSDEGHKANIESSAVGIGIGVCITPAGHIQNVDHPLIFWDQDFSWEPVVIPDPPPHDIPITPHSVWSNKINHNVVTVDSFVRGIVTYHNKHGIVGHFAELKFRQKFDHISG
jgi:uncharacterized protein YkwD